MQKYCLVYLIEKLQEVDEFTAINYWPLHITLASNFIVDWKATNLLDDLAGALSCIKPVTVTVGDDEYFGQERKIQVSVMQMTPQLMSLHKTIISTLEHAGAIFDEAHYNNDGYRAHATVQKTRRLHKGDQITIDQVTIVDMFPHQDTTKRRILQTIQLSAS